MTSNGHALTPDEKVQATTIGLAMASLLRAVVKAPVRHLAIETALRLAGDEGLLAAARVETDEVPR